MRKFLARFRQAPVFSTVYILGAALSVASVMLVAIFLHVKTSNIYPEYSRDKLLYFNYVSIRYNWAIDDPYWTPSEDKKTVDDCWATSTGPIGLPIIDLLKDSLDAVASVAFIAPYLPRESVYVDNQRFDNIKVKYADSGVFDVYDYKTLEGKPFTKEDVESGQMKVMISNRLARKIFGTDRNITGRSISLDHTSKSSSLAIDGLIIDGEELLMTVCGVFEEGSQLLGQSYAEIIAPINDKTVDTNGWMCFGPFSLVIKPDDGTTDEEIKNIMQSQFNRFNAKTYDTGDTKTRSITTYDEDGNPIKTSVTTPIAYQKGNFQLFMNTWPRKSLALELGNQYDHNEEFDFTGITKLYGLLILVLLLVPALNLSSLISGNMDSKMSEMGIRKAFGASNATLLRQVLTENLWLTGCGALLGVLFSWIGVVLWKDWLFTGITETAQELSANDIMLDPAMLFAPKVFIIAVVVCFVLNLLSSLIPACWSLRRPAIDSIKVKS